MVPIESPYATDQYAFRPTGSTDAALITLLHTVSTMLTTQPFVRVFAIDFSKAFDTVRHAVLMEKMARIAIPDACIIGLMTSFAVTHTVQSTMASPRN